MIIVDIETTGVYPEKHAILSIGAVEFEHPENQFYEECRIWEGAEVMQEGEDGMRYALDVNGFTEENIRDQKKKSQKKIMEDFSAWIQTCKEHTFAGENPSFDRDFLRETAKRENISWPLGRRTIDLHSVGYTHMLKRGATPPTKNKRTDLNLDKILVYVGLPEEPKPHHALTGAKCEAEAFSRVLFAKNLLKEYAQYAIPDSLKPEGNNVERTTKDI